MSETSVVYALPLSFERGDHELVINPVAVETPRGLILVDVGLPGAVEQLSVHLEDVGFDWDDVWTVLLTHHDGDHVGALPDVLDRTDALVVAHRDEVPYVDGREEPVKGGEAVGIPVDVELADGVSFRTEAGPMRVVETPGHSPGHVSLHFPESGLLVAGDALTAEDGLAGPKPEFTLDMDEAAVSVGRLADLDVDGVVCYHGGYVEADSEEVRSIYEKLG